MFLYRPPIPFQSAIPSERNERAFTWGPILKRSVGMGERARE